MVEGEVGEKEEKVHGAPGVTPELHALIREEVKAEVKLQVDKAMTDRSEIMLKATCLSRAQSAPRSGSKVRRSGSYLQERRLTPDTAPAEEEGISLRDVLTPRTPSGAINIPQKKRQEVNESSSDVVGFMIEKKEEMEDLLSLCHSYDSESDANLAASEVQAIAAMASTVKDSSIVTPTIEVRQSLVSGRKESSPENSDFATPRQAPQTQPRVVLTMAERAAQLSTQVDSTPTRHQAISPKYEIDPVTRSRFLERVEKQKALDEQGNKLQTPPKPEAEAARQRFMSRVSAYSGAQQ